MLELATYSPEAIARCSRRTGVGRLQGEYRDSARAPRGVCIEGNISVALPEGVRLKAMVSADVANRSEQSMKAGLRVFWPRHARRGWTKGDLPLRLAGTLPWVLRIHAMVLAVIGVGGLLLAVAPLVPTAEPLLGETRRPSPPSNSWRSSESTT